MNYFVYILQSEKDGSFYIGSSKAPFQRLQKHNALHRGYTSKKQPWKIIYTERFQDLQSALKSERYIKSQKSREFLLYLIAGSLAV